MEYAQEAGDVDRAAKLFEQCGPLVYQSGRVATTEPLARLARAHGAMERNAAVAALGAAVASTWGGRRRRRRLFEAAERASYEGQLARRQYLGRLDGLRSCVPSFVGEGGRMGADAEYAVRTLARGSFSRPNARAPARLLAVVGQRG